MEPENLIGFLGQSSSVFITFVAIPFQTTISVEVHIGDVNDNPPTFSQNEYSLEVEELVRLGSPVGNVSAT